MAGVRVPSGVLAGAWDMSGVCVEARCLAGPLRGHGGIMAGPRDPERGLCGGAEPQRGCSEVMAGTRALSGVLAGARGP
jgi:hypothetical protein